MRVTIDPSQIGDFFRNGCLSICKTASGDYCSILLQKCEKTVLDRSNSTKSGSFHHDAFFFGRDIWRKDSFVSSMIMKGIVYQLASRLWWSQKCVRILYDQIIPIGRKVKSSANPFLNAIIQSQFSLSEYSCFSEILGGLVLCLKHEQNDSLNTDDSKLPKQVGDSMFVSSDHVFGACSDGVWYMIVFGSRSSCYLRNDLDPHSREQMRLGYSFGQYLNEAHHPFIHS